MKVIDTLIAAARRRLLGISPEEIRYTIEDVRREIRALRAETKDELAAIRRDIDSLPSRQDRTEGPEVPVAEA
jgi:hypothetical protein